MPHARVLDWRGFLDLEHQVGAGPHALCGGDHLCPGGLELGVWDRRALTRARLDQNLMATAGQLGDPGRGDADMHELNCEESSTRVQRRRRHASKMSK